MTDVQIAALVAAYSDQTSHSIDAYYQAVADYLDRYDTQRIADIGKGRNLDGRGQMASNIQAVWVACGTHVRMAIVEVYDPLYAGTWPIKGYDGKPVKWEQPEFVSWPDDDMKRTARTRTEEKYGKKQLDLINATNADTGMKEVDEWARGLNEARR